MSCASAPNGCRVYCFGGVMDQEETEDNLRGQFSNEIYYFEVISIDIFGQYVVFRLKIRIANAW